MNDSIDLNHGYTSHTQTKYNQLMLFKLSILTKLSKIFEFEQNGKMFDAIESLDKYISEFDGETLSLSLAKNRMLVCAGNFDDAKELSTQLEFVAGQKNDKAAEIERLAYEALSYFFQDRLDMEKIILEKVL